MLTVQRYVGAQPDGKGAINSCIVNLQLLRKDESAVWPADCLRAGGGGGSAVGLFNKLQEYRAERKAIMAARSISLTSQDIRKAALEIQGLHLKLARAVRGRDSTAIVYARENLKRAILEFRSTVGRVAEEIAPHEFDAFTQLEIEIVYATEKNLSLWRPFVVRPS
jgi:hypothetical protein